MRIGIGGIWHETNTFASTRTTLKEFQQHLLVRGREVIETLDGTETEIGGMIAASRELGFEPVPSLYAGATPSGIVDERDFQNLVEALLEGLRSQGPLDGILLALHGAMVTEGQDDPEGYLLSRVREAFGSIPIAMTLDLHANISRAMVEQADILVGYDTYPHTDFFARGHEAATLLVRTIRGEIRPTMALYQVPLMPPVETMLTEKEPMKALIEAAHQAEAEPGVLAVTVAGGFPYADVPFAGVSVVAITHQDPGQAQEIAHRIGQEAIRRAEEFTVQLLPVDEGIKRAMAAPKGPVILVDGADNVGGGAPGDGTVVLEGLLRLGAQGAVICLADPEAVQECHRAGVGATVTLEVGGKTDGLHGAPVKVQGRVRTLGDGEFVYKGSYMTGKRVHMGKTAVVACGGTTLLLTELRTMPFDQEQLRSVGLDPMDFHIIVVKSAVAWRAAYGPIAAEIIPVNTPGICAADLSHFTYKKRQRPVFPLDPLPVVMDFLNG